MYVVVVAGRRGGGGGGGDGSGGGVRQERISLQYLAPNIPHAV